MEGEVKSIPDKKKKKKNPQRIYLLQTNSARDANGSALRTGKKKPVRERRTQVQKNGNEGVSITNNLK